MLQIWSSNLFYQSEPAWTQTSAISPSISACTRCYCAPRWFGEAPVIKKSLANKIWKCTRENDRISLFVIDSPRHFVVFRLSCLEKHNLHFPWISLWKKRDRKQNSVLTTTDSTIYSESLCLWFQLPVFNLVYMEEHKVQD